jgi:hypothetical protein
MSQQPPAQGGWTPDVEQEPQSPPADGQPGSGSTTGTNTGTPEDAPDGPGSGQLPASSGSDAGEAFSLIKAFGGWSGLLDAGLPTVAFLVTYPVSGRDLRLSLIVAIAIGVVLTIVRLIRRDPLQNVIGGFLGLALAAWIANKTGKAENFYLPGLLINAGYAIVYSVANLVRWPPIGLVVGLGAGWGLTWRQDPVLVRAFVRAGWLWVGVFAVRIAVQLPLYLSGQVDALGIARVAMGWPLFLVLMWLTYIVIKASVPPTKWAEVKRSAEAAAAKRNR